MISIKTRPCEVYESFVADADTEHHFFEVRRDANDARTRVRIANRTRDLSFSFYLTDDELDALQTMLAEAYDSQERTE